LNKEIRIIRFHFCFFGDALVLCVFFILGARELAAVGAVGTVAFFDGEAGTGHFAGLLSQGASGLTVTDLPWFAAFAAGFSIGSRACFFRGLVAGATLGGVVESDA
jgi:hypothetical protein